MHIRPIDKLNRALETHGIHVPEKGNCRCPAHADRQPSLSIKETDDGKVLIKCHAGCSAEQICQAIGLTLRDLMPEEDCYPCASASQHRPKEQAKSFPSADAAIRDLESGPGKATTVYWYQDASGETIGAIVRWDEENGKRIRPVSRIGESWQQSGMASPRPLYGLSELANAETVFVVEGEQCVHAARTISIVATCSAHGAQSAKGTDWSPLAGKVVIILPDNDKAGEQYAADVVALLGQLDPQPTVKIVRLPDLPDGGDIDDWLERMGDAEPEEIRLQLFQLIDATEPEILSDPHPLSVTETNFKTSVDASRLTTKSGLVFTPISQLASGPPVQWIWEGILSPGHSTALISHAKVGKSTLLGHFLRCRKDGGELAGYIKPGCTLIVSEESETQWNRRRESLDIESETHVCCRPFKGRPRLAEWSSKIEEITDIAKNIGADLVVFDTWQSVAPMENENDSLQVTAALNQLHHFTTAGIAVLVVHHSRKSDGGEGLASRGSSAFGGFFDILVEFRRLHAENIHDTRRVITGFGRFDEVPRKVVIELNDDKYHVVGTQSDARYSDRIQVAINLLSRSPDSTEQDLLKMWDNNQSIPKPGRSALRGDLQLAVDQGRLERSGRGVKGDPFKYRISPHSKAPAPLEDYSFDDWMSDQSQLF